MRFRRQSGSLAEQQIKKVARWGGFFLIRNSECGMRNFARKIDTAVKIVPALHKGTIRLPCTQSRTEELSWRQSAMTEGAPAAAAMVGNAARGIASPAKIVYNKSR